MTKKSGRLLKKRILIWVIAGLSILIIGAGVVYYFYPHHPQRAVEADKQTRVVADEHKKLDESAFKGDRDAAAQYAQKIQAGQSDAAYSVYKSAADKTNTDAAKIAIYEQAVGVASRAKQTDQAIQFAVQLSDLSNTHRASANVAYLYGQKKDTVNQKKYLQQALAQLEVLPKASAEYTSFKAYYQEMLSKVGGS